MRIAFVNSTRAWGGGERWHLEMAAGLRDEGLQPWLLVHSEGELRHRAEALGLDVVPMRLHRLSGLLPHRYFALRRLFKDRAPEAVILNGPVDLKSVAIAARGARCPRIIYRRGSALPIRDTALNRWLFKRVVDRVIVNSEATRQSLVEKSPRLLDLQRVTTIYNPLQSQWRSLPSAAPASDAASASELRLGTVGRLVEQKGQLDLIEVMDRLGDQGVKSTLAIAGDGPMRKELVERAASSASADRIHFHGEVQDVPSFLGQLDVFLFPSRWEGFGYAVVEAQAAGLPVVAYDASSNPEVTDRDRSAFLVPAGDVAAFTEATMLLARDASLRQRMGAHGQSFVRNRFDPATARADLLRFLATID